MKSKATLFTRLLTVSAILTPAIFLGACWGQGVSVTPATTSNQPSGSISMADMPVSADEDETPASTDAPILSQENSTTGTNPQYSIFLIALSDNGQNGTAIGCGDSVVPVSEDSKTPNATETQLLNEAFTNLLSLDQKDNADNGYSDFLADSKLKLESAEIKNGVATIKLSGQLSLAGECDDPRLKAQLEFTAKQFSDIKSAEIFINGKSLDSVMSLKG